MTADATLPASDDLTPEVLARKSLHEVVVRWEDHGGNIERMIWCDFAEPLLSGVRSRDARIAELEAVIAAVSKTGGLPIDQWWSHLRDLVLSAEPMSVLAARDAEKWDEGFNACASGGSLRNPYQAGATNG